MAATDLPPVGRFDSSPFVTYDNEEDSTPTAAELIEDLPEREVSAIEVAAAEKGKRPFRGKGYLRAESAEEGPSADNDGEDPESEFGAGLDDAESAPSKIDQPAADSGKSDHFDAVVASRTDNAVSGPSHDRTGKTATHNEESSDTGQKRRRRRSRRRKGQIPTTENANSSSPDASLTTDAVGSVDGSAASKKSDDDGKEQKSEEGGARNRRRRGRRRRGKDGGSPGNVAGPSSE